MTNGPNGPWGMGQALVGERFNRPLGLLDELLRKKIRDEMGGDTTQSYQPLVDIGRLKR